MTVSLKSVKRSLVTNAKNIPGWRTKRRIVVFESDDWGSNRVSSLESLKLLGHLGVLDRSQPTQCVDTLACKGDLDALASVLSGFRDSLGRHPVLSMFVNPANPDFGKIEAAGYGQYYAEPLTETMTRDSRFAGTLDSWKKAVDDELFSICYHGREHLNVPVWMEFLRKSDSLTRKCFQYQFYSVPEPDLPPHCIAFRPAYFCMSESMRPQYSEILRDGLKMLNEIFDCNVTSYCPPNGISHPQFDADLAELGVQTIVSKYVRKNTDFRGGVNRQFFRFGQRNGDAQIFHVRNCVFEPVNGNQVERAMRGIAAAFRWGKPAVISTHAVNYIGGLSVQNRGQGLKELHSLLHEIVKRWPGVEFMSSVEMSAVIRANLES